MVHGASNTVCSNNILNLNHIEPLLCMPPKRSREDFEPSALHAGEEVEGGVCFNDEQNRATSFDHPGGQTSQMPHAHPQVGTLHCTARH